MSGESARLFVALELPPMASGELVRWCQAELHRAPGLRAVRREAMHVTLCFLGSRPLAEIEQIADVCAEIGDAGLIELAFEEVVWLPRRRPSVVAIGLGEPGDDARPAARQSRLAALQSRLAALQSRLASALEAAGLYEPEQRAFFGHVTVARVRRGTQTRPVELPAPEPLHFSASTVTLFRSRPQRGGSQYERLHTVGLEP